MTEDLKEYCACLHVQYNPKKTVDGRSRERWNCTSCGSAFDRNPWEDLAIPRPLELDSFDSVDKIFITGYDAAGDPEDDDRTVTAIKVEVNDGPEQRFVPESVPVDRSRELLQAIKKRLRGLATNVWKVKGDPSRTIDPTLLGEILEETLDTINKALEK